MATTAPQKQFVPLNQAAQGGIVDDIDVLIADAAFVQWDYNGAIDHEVLALGIQFQDDNGKQYDQYYSAGELTYFVPSDDGAGIVPVADKQMINDNTNAWKFISSLMECGFPEDKLASGNVKEFVGTKVHIKQIAQPVRQGLIRGGKNADRTPTVLLVTAILGLPGEQQAAKPKTTVGGKVPGAQTRPTPTQTKLGSAPTAAGKAATSQARLGASTASSSKSVKPNGAAGASVPAASDDHLTIALDVLNEILMEQGGPVIKKDLSKLAFQKLGERVQAGTLDAKLKTKMAQLIFQDANLHAWQEQGAIQYDGAQVSLPE
jgi:hypothetical protein